MKSYKDVFRNLRVSSIDEMCEDGKIMGGSVRLPNGKFLNFVAGWDENGKEHVSVSLADGRKFRRGELPTWDDMCYVKDIFWDEEEEVFQIHPPRSCYCDLGAVLHLWRAKDGGEIHAEGMPKSTRRTCKPIDMSDKIYPPHQYRCEHCDAGVWPLWDYCAACGAELVWKDDEYAMKKRREEYGVNIP